jgi:anaerobic magnesium-protoporphyrin IX monomethyl ester cyclase
MISRLLFVEPPKDYWFLMGEYLPPPTGLLALAAFVEREVPDIEIDIIDCQAEDLGWKELEKRIEDLSPSMVCASGFTCNAYACARVAEITKSIEGDIITLAGGQHFSFTADESLNDFPEIDFIVRGEGEVTLVELINTLRAGKTTARIKGLSFRHNGKNIHNRERGLIENLDTLPYPAYHLIKKNLSKYHFSMMAGKNTRYMILEGSRGCSHKCKFCTQWKHWNGVWRTKSASRIADEMEFLNDSFGGEFLWLTDDNFGYSKRASELWKELRSRKFTDNISWFFQARTDEVVKNPDLVGKLRDVGNTWNLIGVESHSPEVLKDFNKGVKVEDAYKAIKILNDNDILTQAMFVIGSRRDNSKSIEKLRQFSLDLGTDLSIYTILTPYPGTVIHEEAVSNNWLEDRNYAHYDMIHAVMPTETLSRKEVQEEVLACYRAFYGPLAKNIAGFFSKNEIKRRAYRHMAGKKVLKKLRQMI